MSTEAGLLVFVFDYGLSDLSEALVDQRLLLGLVGGSHMRSARGRHIRVEEALVACKDTLRLVSVGRGRLSGLKGPGDHRGWGFGDLLAGGLGNCHPVGGGSLRRRSELVCIASPV